MVTELHQPAQKFLRAYMDRPKIMDTPEWEQATQIFNRWHNDQLRPEGRASIYLDDEAVLISAIAQALIEVKENPMDCLVCGYPAEEVHPNRVWKCDRCQESFTRLTEEENRLLEKK